MCLFCSGSEGICWVVLVGLQDMDTKGMKSSIITYNPSIQKMECKES